MVVAAFVAPYLLPATTRFVDAAARLPGVQLALITCEPASKVPDELRGVLAAHWRVDDALDPYQLATAVREVGHRLGSVERLVAALEQLQVPLAMVREMLGIPGMDVESALNVRDKARMKTVLRAAGLPCARHQLVIDPAAAADFARQVGFPLVVKPPAGAGAQETFRLDDAGALDAWLSAAPPSGERPALMEEFLTGDEHSFDSVTVGGEVVWHSISDYLPTPLQVLRNPWMQWVVLLPADIGGPEYAGIKDAGPAALRALGVRHALTHMEWFRRPDGTVAISEVAARPPGAQISSMLGYAHDIDFHGTWAKLMIDGGFEPPPRNWAVGTAYLRGQGRGIVRAVHGVEDLQREIGHLVVETRLPKPGQPASGTYEGDGYVIVRDRDTEVVANALHRIITGLRVELVEI